MKNSNEPRNSLIKKLSKTFSNISYDSVGEKEKVKSCLSVKDNPELISNLDQILVYILKLNDEILSEKDEDKYSHKLDLISKLLEAVKLLSQNSDNHQTILENVKLFILKSEFENIIIDKFELLEKA